ncbi:MAG TPA: selenocysteine-specific translation elongation factor [Candidatus Methylomirabilis sp.]|jgi:selenocysteine-specific elongation factor
MKHIIVGTAGHIDHGKTTLVRALTGIDTDRLKEEKERGISIELGFAYLKPSEDLSLGIVDVPGHERFVKTMLAGVGGIDLVVLVIAADEGIMPQTREHLHICQLLHIKRGLVALTKADLVEPDWLDMVRGEVAAFLRGTFLAGCPIVPVSATTGRGLKELTEALAVLAADVEPKRTEGVFRLPIDRVFTMKGFGTVVTGTVLAGTLKVGEEVVVLPRGHRSRVRRLQVHGANVEAALAGQRTAVNLPGIEVAQIERGDVLARPDTLRAGLAMDATLSLLPDAPRPLANRGRVRFHLGTSEVLARVALLDRDELAPGQEAYVHFRLESPAAALPRDRYVIRSYSPMITIGGGAILDPSPPQRRRPRERILETLKVLEKGSPAEQMERLLLNAGPVPAASEGLRAAADMDRATADAALEALRKSGAAVPLGARGTEFLHRDVAQRLEETVTRLLADFHKREPLKDGLAKEEIRSKLPPQLPPAGFAWLLGWLGERQAIAVEKDKVRLFTHRPTLSAADEAVREKLERAYREAAFQPPTQAEALAAVGGDRKLAQAVFRRVVDDGVLVRMGGDLYVHRDAYGRMRATLGEFLKAKGSISVPGFKDLLGISRKYAIPFLEHFDEVRLTRRQGDERVLHG